MKRTRIFQSTLPAGGATLYSSMMAAHSARFQSTLPAGGATLDGLTDFQRQNVFQSTLPAGGATIRRNPPIPRHPISIHAPRGGSDLLMRCVAKHFREISIHAPRGGSDRQNHQLRRRTQHDFNPRSPRGERLIDNLDLLLHHRFQSTLPAGGATTECLARLVCCGNFNPRSPRGERQQKCMFFMREFIHIP